MRKFPRRRPERLLEIKNQEGETVEVGSVVALVGAEGASPVPSPKSQRLKSSRRVQQRESRSKRCKPVSETEGGSYDYQRPCRSRMRENRTANRAAKCRSKICAGQNRARWFAISPKNTASISRRIPGSRHERARDEKRHYVVYRIGRGAKAAGSASAKPRRRRRSTCSAAPAQKPQYTAPHVRPQRPATASSRCR